MQINCGVSDFAFTNGIARARTFVLDTDDAVIETTGGIDLRSERLALTIHPDSKGLRIFSLRSPLYVGGTMKKPTVSPDIGVLALRAGGALSLALLAPVATAVLPLVDLSPGGDSNKCAALLADLRKRPVAPPPGKTYKDPRAGGTAGMTAGKPIPPETPGTAAQAEAQAGRPAHPSRPAEREARKPVRPDNDAALYKGA
ncbi:hypothetical protein D3C81_1688970 [compost metagenome]